MLFLPEPRAPSVDLCRDVGAFRQAIGPDVVRAATGNIESRGEGLPRAGEDDGAHLRIGIGGIKGVVEFNVQLIGDGVHHLGTIERDEHAAALLLIEQILVVHSVVRLIIRHRSPASCALAAQAASMLAEHGMRRRGDR